MPQVTKSPEELQTRMLTVRCTPAEHERIKKAAWSDKTSINQFALAAILAAAGAVEADVDAETGEAVPPTA